MRTTFMVGKVTRRGSEMVLVEAAPHKSIPGPWSLKALVRPAPSQITQDVPTDVRVH
jgi:hypothetical protein